MDNIRLPIAAGNTAEDAAAWSCAATKEFEETGVKAKFAIAVARSAMHAVAGRGMSAMQGLPVVEEEETQREELPKSTRI